MTPVGIGVLLACGLAGFDALSGLPAAFAAWSRASAALGRVAALLATPAPVPAPEQPASVGDREVGLRVVDAQVAPAAGVAVVVSADLELRPGDRVAITGPSGCGKSTLLRAALRLAPVRAGSLAVSTDAGHAALADLAPADVPPLAAGSLQGDHVFDATLRDNLRVVRPSATDAELDAVANRAGLGRFVAGLPRGWSTPAGADGAALSGGQRQRLLLARALLADPAILVLDEPTAHLDPGTERVVLADLLRATAGRTVLLSTHRALADGSVNLALDLGCPEPNARPTPERPVGLRG